jgi:hypothetical protein
MKAFNLICIITLLVSLTTLGICQNRQYKLSGYLGIKGGESFNYDLELEDSTENYLTGYAYTYASKDKDVKAKIIGIIDRLNKTLYIRESTILHNKGFKSKAVICLLESKMEYNTIDQILHGRLATKTAGSGALPCSDGSLSFIKADELKSLFSSKNDTKNTDNIHINNEITQTNKNVNYIYKDTAINKVKPSNSIAKTAVKTTITEGKDKIIDWNSKTLKIEIWDGNNEDGDKINLLLNGQIVLKEYTLRNKPHILNLDISNNELSILTIEALNAGGDPPNTANLKLWDGEDFHDIIAHNQPEKKALIRIKRKI